MQVPSERVYTQHLYLKPWLQANVSLVTPPRPAAWCTHTRSQIPNRIKATTRDLKSKLHWSSTFFCKNRWRNKIKHSLHFLLKVIEDIKKKNNNKNICFCKLVIMPHFLLKTYITTHSSTFYAVFCFKKIYKELFRDWFNIINETLTYSSPNRICCFSPQLSAVPERAVDKSEPW